MHPRDFVSRVWRVFVLNLRIHTACDVKDIAYIVSPVVTVKKIFVVPTWSNTIRAAEMRSTQSRTAEYGCTCKQ